MPFELWVRNAVRCKNMEIKDYHKRWLLKKVDGVWHKVVSSPSGYVTTILRLHETTAQNFADLRDADDQAGLSMPDLLDLIHDILPEDFVADVRSARKVKGEDGVPIGFFEANGSPNSRGCKGVIGHDLDWSEIYATNVLAHPRRDKSPNSTIKLIAVGWSVLFAFFSGGRRLSGGAGRHP